MTLSTTGQAMELARRSAQRRRKLTLDDVERELPPMDTAEHVRAGLQLVQRWACAGMLPGTVANAAVRAAEVWLKLHEHEFDRDRIRDLERQLRELKAKRASGVPA